MFAIALALLFLVKLFLKKIFMLRNEHYFAKMICDFFKRHLIHQKMQPKLFSQRLYFLFVMSQCGQFSVFDSGQC